MADLDNPRMDEHPGSARLEQRPMDEHPGNARLEQRPTAVAAVKALTLPPPLTSTAATRKLRRFWIKKGTPIKQGRVVGLVQNGAVKWRSIRLQDIQLHSAPTPKTATAVIKQEL